MLRLASGDLTELDEANQLFVTRLYAIFEQIIEFYETCGL